MVKLLGSSVLLAAALAAPAQALHFFMDGALQKCFYEELPKETMVVGKIHVPKVPERKHMELRYSKG